MMRYMLMVCMLVLLAACGGSNGDDGGTADVPAETNAPPVVGETSDELEEMIAEAAGLGERITPEAVVTEDPLAGELFDYVFFQQTGGLEEIDTTLEIFSDGRVVMDGREGRATEADVEGLQEVFDDIALFVLSPPSPVRDARPENYRYSIRVEQGDRFNAFEIIDTQITPPLRALIAALTRFREFAG